MIPTQKTVKPRAGLAAAADKVEDLSMENNEFWAPVLDQNNVLKDVRIKLLNFYELIYRLGFRRFDVGTESVFVRIIENRILRQATVTDMQDAVYNWLDQLPQVIDEKYGLNKRMIKEKIHKGVSSFFSTQRLYILKPKERIEFQRDNYQEKYMYFKNGFLRITAAKQEFLPYADLEGYIWENQQIRRDYQAVKDQPEKNYVRRFMELVAGNAERFSDLKIITGYLMHQFTDYKLKGIVLTDSKISEDEDEGRTGKTLYARCVGNAMSHDFRDKSITTYVEFNGKDFDPANKHKYADCNLDTNLILINDLRKYVKVESFFNDVTEGVTVDKKGKDPFRIVTKMIFTTNSSLEIKGASAKDRFLEYEFANYFHPGHTPEMEFKHWFFRDWQPEDWNRFYTFMAECCQVFLGAGCKMKEPDQINLARRKLLEHTAPEFVEWVETELMPKNGQPHAYGELYEKFTGSYPDFKSDKFKQRRFKEWLKTYCNLHPDYMDYNKERNETRDAQNRYFTFWKNQ